MVCWIQKCVFLEILELACFTNFPDRSLCVFYYSRKSGPRHACPWMVLGEILPLMWSGFWWITDLHSPSASLKRTSPATLRTQSPASCLHTLQEAIPEPTVDMERHCPGAYAQWNVWPGALAGYIVCACGVQGHGWSPAHTPATEAELQLASV